MKSKLAIFDLDGTLFDTNDVNYYSYKEALKPFGADIDKDYFASQCNGRKYTEFLPGIMGGEEHINEVHQRKKNLYAENLKYARANEDLFSIIKAIKNEYHIALVTTASKKNSNDILNYFGYDDLFDLMLTQEDIERTKPDPQGFLMAMRHFSVEPENTLIFEDSEVGIQAAVASKANVVRVVKF